MTDPMREALKHAREAIATLPDDALGYGGDDDGRHWPLRRELLSKIDEALSAPPHPAPAVQEWRTDMENAPRDGTRFDAYCVRHPNSKLGVRFTDIQMRGDNSGFGFVSHTAAGVVWHYLEKEDDVYPSWTPTHWMPKIAPPAAAHAGGAK